MIISFAQLLRITRNCPDEKIVLMPQSKFSLVVDNFTHEYYRRVAKMTDFVHSVTGEYLDLPPETLLEVVDPKGFVKKLLILGY